jgi:uncharacterized membrane protein YobD (UPF0266 family)
MRTQAIARPLLVAVGLFSRTMDFFRKNRALPVNKGFFLVSFDFNFSRKKRLSSVSYGFSP